jgi:acyl carrier protein
MSTPVDAEAFTMRTVDWINRTLVPEGVAVDADTPLFANGLINSIRILKLIAWTEHLTGRRIPDKAIRMDNFRTVRRITDVFCAPETAGGADVAA